MNAGPTCAAFVLAGAAVPKPSGVPDAKLAARVVAGHVHLVTDAGATDKPSDTPKAVDGDTVSSFEALDRTAYEIVAPLARLRSDGTLPKVGLDPAAACAAQVRVSELARLDDAASSSASSSSAAAGAGPKSGAGAGAGKASGGAVRSASGAATPVQPADDEDDSVSRGASGHRRKQRHRKRGGNRRRGQSGKP